MPKPPVNVTLTCPVCGQTEEAQGASNLYVGPDINGKMVTTISYSASAVHDCPNITQPA